MIKIFYFPHGTSVDNENDISSGWVDAKLSELGIRQSKELPKQIGDKKFDAVFCSDLKRAVDSANLAFKSTVPIVVDERLRECNYGKYNGRPSDIVEPLQEQHITTPFPKGESYEDVKRRMAEFLQDIKKEYEGKSIAIIAHKAPQFALEVLLKDKTWDQVFKEDWRITKSWQPGWEYTLN